MNFTVRCGQLCEAAGVIIANAAATATTARQDAYDINMRSSLQEVDVPAISADRWIKSGLLRVVEAELPRRLCNAGALALDRLRKRRESAGIVDQLTRRVNGKTPVPDRSDARSAKPKLTCPQSGKTK
jgi:hypothetical protein